MQNRRRKTASNDLESGSELNETQSKLADLEILVANLRQLLEKSKYREMKLMKQLEEMGCKIPFESEQLHDDSITSNTNLTPIYFDNSTFIQNMRDRAIWLIGLLTFQSFSSFILSSNQELLNNHPSLVYFLTMLVGAGGNAGNQATVRVIREMAVGSLHGNAKFKFIQREFLMALVLSGIVGTFGFFRVLIFSKALLSEAITISIALVAIVLISIVCGALLPFLFQLIHLDPANSSTTIQVLMDISGVLITCIIAILLLDTTMGQTFIKFISFGFIG